MSDFLLYAARNPQLAGVGQVATVFEAAQHRTVRIDDLVPQPGDYRGRCGFYLVIGWICGGYLVASMLGVVSGARPANARRAAIRLLSILPMIVGGAAVALLSSLR